MNYLHALSPEWTWPEVDEAAFEAAINRFDYRREGYGDCIVYLERRSGNRLGMEVGSKRQNSLRYFLKPATTP